MATREEKKAFALKQIKPYAKDPSLCGVQNGSCYYLTQDGKMCVAGKNMLYPKEFAELGEGIGSILQNKGQSIFKPEARGILTIKEWNYLQHIHDNIAHDLPGDITYWCNTLDLFSYEELIAD